MNVYKSALRFVNGVNDMHRMLKRQHGDHKYYQIVGSGHWWIVDTYPPRIQTLSIAFGIDKRWKPQFMSFGGRLVLLKIVMLSCIAHMQIFGFPPTKLSLGGIFLGIQT